MNPDNSFCLWDPKGNGHYATECGYVIYDYGRLRAMQIEVYGDERSKLKVIEVCPNCKRKVTISLGIRTKEE